MRKHLQLINNFQLDQKIRISPVIDQTILHSSPALLGVQCQSIWEACVNNPWVFVQKATKLLYTCDKGGLCSVSHAKPPFSLGPSQYAATLGHLFTLALFALLCAFEEEKNTFEERTLSFPSHLFLPANMWPLFLLLHCLSFSKSIGNMSAGFYMKSLSWRFFWFLQQSSFCLALARSQSLCYEADKSQILVRNAGLRVCMLHSVYSRRDIISMPIDDYIPKIKPILNVSRNQGSSSTRNMWNIFVAVFWLL